MAISEFADLSIDNVPLRNSENSRIVPYVHPRDPEAKVEFVFREQDENGDFQFVTRTAEEIFKGRRLAIFGLPGAFTPTCSDIQLPAYEVAYDDFIAKGIDEVYCVSVNDAFVMNAWFEKQGITKVKALPDGNGIFTWCCDLMVSKNNLGFGNRSWRYAAIVDDGIFEQCFEEAGKTNNCGTDPYENSTPERLLATLG